MDAVNFYHELYRLIGEHTPLGFDCGRLCGGACCSVSLPGMYLFPGEEALLRRVKGFTISEADLPGYGPVPLLSCEGHCSRNARPLACRVFPLAPKVQGGTASARMDPRGRPVCPLCHEQPGALSAAFVGAAGEAFSALLRQPETAEFLCALSAAIDEYEQLFL